MSSRNVQNLLERFNACVLLLGLSYYFMFASVFWVFPFPFLYLYWRTLLFSIPPAPQGLGIIIFETPIIMSLTWISFRSVLMTWNYPSWYLIIQNFGVFSVPMKVLIPIFTMPLGRYNKGVRETQLIEGAIALRYQELANKWGGCHEEVQSLIGQWSDECILIVDCRPRHAYEGSWQGLHFFIQYPFIWKLVVHFLL